MSDILISAIAGIAAFFIASQVKEKPQPQQATERYIESIPRQEERVQYEYKVEDAPSAQRAIYSPSPEWTEQVDISAEAESPQVSRMSDFQKAAKKMSSAMGSFDNKGGMYGGWN